MRNIVFSLINLLFVCSSLSAQMSLSDVETKAYMEERKNLQGRFAVAQSKLAQKPEESSAEAQSKMEEVNKDLDKLAQKALSYETSRLATWNNEGFWYVTLKSGRTYSYWNSGPSAKFVVQKFEDQLAKIKTLKVTTTGPFKKPDLNESQKMLDAIRGALDLDIELTRLAKQYLNR
jgi:hypothetical protein